MKYNEFTELTSLVDDDVLLIQEGSTLALKKIKLSTLKEYIGVASGGVATGIKDEILKDNPIGYWQLDELSGIIANNLGSGMSNGTYSNVVLGQTKLANGSAYSASFNGKNSKVLFTNTLLSNSIDISLECVVKLSSTTLKGSFIKLGSGTAGGSGLAIGVGNTTHDDLGNKLIALSEGIVWKNTSQNIGIGTHHIVLVFRGATTKEWLFYLDGILVFTLPASNIYTPASEGYIGTGDNNRFVNALIDEVAIYNKELLAVRCLAHANTVIY